MNFQRGGRFDINSKDYQAGGILRPVKNTTRVLPFKIIVPVCKSWQESAILIGGMRYLRRYCFETGSFSDDFFR